MTHRSLSISSNAPDSAATSVTAAATEPSDTARKTTPVSAVLDSATPTALLTGVIDVGQAPCPLSALGLMRIGIGPSSSHTVGPMRAGRTFSRVLAEAARPGGAGDPDGKCVSPILGAGLPQPSRVTIELYGPLGATGRGHATNRAAVMGLAGCEPETVPAVVCKSLMEEVGTTGELMINGVGPIPFSPNADVHFLPGRILPYHVNGMILAAYYANGAEILRRTYYSVGGGSVMGDVGTPGSPLAQALAIASVTQAHVTSAPFPFTTSTAVLAIHERESLSVFDVVLANELFTHSRKEIMVYLGRLCAMMHTCIEAGMDAEGILPGGLSVRRRAKALHERLRAQSTGLAAALTMADPLRGMDRVDLFALVVNREGATGHCMVTTPASGTVRIVPAVLTYYERFIPGVDDDGARRFLPTATAVGRLIKTNTSITGVEMSCQGEIGSASSMAAVGLAEALGGAPAQAENAAEITMKHDLELIYDPVDGLVQIPCTEHNAMAVVKAINTARMAPWGEGRHAVSLGIVIKTIRQTDEDMFAKYREASRDDLAVNVVEY